METLVRTEGRQQRTHFQNKGAVLPLQRGLLHLRLPLRADGGAWIERGAGGQDHQAVRGNRQGGVHRRHQLLSHVFVFKIFEVHTIDAISERSLELF